MSEYTKLTFEVNTKLYEQANEWAEMHQSQCRFKKNVGAIGGSLTWSFTQTGIGEVCKLSCACGEKFDASDYDVW